MDTSAVSSVTNAGYTPTKTQSSADLDKQSFLKLLTAQMSNQDPTSTQDPNQYFNTISQMTMVEQLTNTAQSTSEGNAVAMIGRTIAYTDSSGALASGVVTAADVSGTNPTLTVGDTDDIAMTSIKAVT